MARRLHLLLLVLTCLSVGAEMLVAATGLPVPPTDQVHDCGTEEPRLNGELDSGGEANPAGPAPSTGPETATPGSCVETLAQPWLGGRAGMRRHRWCGVDLN